MSNVARSDVVPLAIAPDLVIEVVSKYVQPDDLMHEVRQYLQAGVRAVRLLYRKTREAYRYTPEALQSTVIIAESVGKFEEAELLRGFQLLLSDFLQ